MCKWVCTFYLQQDLIACCLAHILVSLKHRQSTIMNFPLTNTQTHSHTHTYFCYTNSPAWQELLSRLLFLANNANKTALICSTFTTFSDLWRVSLCVCVFAVWNKCVWLKACAMWNVCVCQYCWIWVYSLCVYVRCEVCDVCTSTVWFNSMYSMYFLSMKSVICATMFNLCANLLNGTA